LDTLRLPRPYRSLNWERLAQHSELRHNEPSLKSSLQSPRELYTVTNCNASTSRMNCRSWSGGTSTGSEVTIFLRCSKACIHSSVQRKATPFLSRLVSGRAMFANPGMNGHWNPRTPKVLRTSFMFFKILGHSPILAILLGLIVISLCPSHTPRKSTSGCSNTHFDSLRKYECCSKRSSSL
jgi:hypothetical protein